MNFSNWPFIVLYLDVRDFIALSSTSKKMREILLYEHIWANLLKEYNFSDETIIEKKPETLTFQAYFKEIYGLYKEIKKNLFKISNQLKYEDYFSPNSPLDKKKRDHLKSIIKQSYNVVPISYFLLYYIMNGQNSLNFLPNYENSRAFFGGFSYYYQYYEFFFLPLETKICGYLTNMKFHALAEESHGFNIFIDFGNMLGFGPEAIFSILSKESTVDGEFYKIFLMSTNLLNYIRKIAKCTFDHNPKKLYLDHFDTLNSPDSDVTTNGIRIRAKAFNNPWDIRMGTTTFFFPYQIRISDAGVSGACKLVSRKWIIRDGNKEECVNGEGVIGMYPVISPGCEDFVYESVSMIKSLQGDMEGSFLFKSEGGDQGIIEAKIGRFKFEIGEDSRLLKVNFLNKKIEVLS